MRLRERFQRMMYGRYGNDQLGMFCFFAYLAIWFVTMLFRGSRVAAVLTVISYMFAIVYFFRFFSRNIYRRQQENQKFLSVFSKVQTYVKYCRFRFQERHSTKKLFRCPKCHQMIRVPRGHGKVAIRCPKCKFEFIKRT